MAKILLLEDDINLSKGIKIALESDDHQITLAHSYFEGVEMFLSQDCGAFDLYILDINLPDGNGMEFCKKIREKTTTPVIFLTANDTEEDTVRGFENGADDYVAKPFSLEILKQRIRAVLRRGSAGDSGDNSSEFVYQDLAVNFDKMKIRVRGDDVRLTATEFKILEFLAKNKGKVVTREMMLERIWDIDSDFVDENTLSVNIRRLRQKIENDPKNPEYIVTVFGIGYTLGN